MVTNKPAEVIDILRKLQALDDEIRDIKVSRDAMVSNMDRLRKVLSHLDRELADQKGKLAEAETWYRTKAGELETEREKLSKAKSKLSGVTRSKEYVAVNKELDNLRKSITTREDELANLDKANQDFREAIAKKEQQLKDLRSQAEHEEHSGKERLAAMEAKIAEVDTRRRQITSQVEPSVVSRYNKIAAARAGKAVVPVRDGSCTGCNMVLAPRFVETVLRASGLILCPHCNRYLYADTSHDADGNVATL